jgi:hypothetical protein
VLVGMVRGEGVKVKVKCEEGKNEEQGVWREGRGSAPARRRRRFRFLAS